MSLSPCTAPGAAVPPSVRSSASSQYCRGSSSSRKLCFPAFFTGVSQASVLLGKHAIQRTEAKINRGIPPTFISIFYLKSTSNNLVVKLLRYNAMYYLKYNTNSYDFELHLLLSGGLAPSSDVWRSQTTNQAEGVSCAHWWELI